MGMQNKIEAEGEKENKIHEKFMCYCQNSGGELTKSVEEAQQRIPDLESQIEGDEGILTQLKGDITAHKSDRATAKTAIAEATGIRERDHEAYTKEEAEASTNLAAVKKSSQSTGKRLGVCFF